MGNKTPNVEGSKTSYIKALIETLLGGAVSFTIDKGIRTLTPPEYGTVTIHFQNGKYTFHEVKSTHKDV